MKVYAFLDTNILLHYQPFEQIKWESVLKASQVVLVFAPIVIRELDRHKNNQNTTKRSKERAGKVVVRLSEFWAESSTSPLNEKVSLEYLLDEPTINFG